MLNLKIQKSFLFVNSFIIVLLLVGAGNIFPRIAWGIIMFIFMLEIVNDTINNNQTLKRKSIYIFFLTSIWLLIPFASTPLYFDMQTNIKQILETTLYVLFSILICSWLDRDRKNIKILIKKVTFFWIFINFLFFLLYLLDLIEYQTTFSGLYLNRNLFAIVSTLLVISVLCFIQNKTTKIIYVALLILSVLITSSIKGLIGVVLVIYLFCIKHLHIHKLIISLLLISLVVVSILQTDSLIATRLDSLVDVLKNKDLSGMGSASERLWLMVNGFQLSLDNFLYGIGLFNSKHYLFPPWQIVKAERIGEVLQVGLYTHINYLEVLLSAGFISLLLYYIPHALIFSKSKKLYNKKIEYKFCGIFIIYKFFLDIAMVSYAVFPLTFFYIYCLFIIFSNYENES